MIADLADRHGDGHVVVGRDQDLLMRNVPIDEVADVRAAVVARGLALKGESADAAVRACTGSSVCALGISPAPEAGRTLLTTPGLRRNPSLRVHVSGCPNSCAQHQMADIGLAGTKVRTGGATRLGFHLYLGADLAAGRVGELVGRMAIDDTPSVIDAVIGTWEATRHPGEGLSATVERIGVGSFAATLEAVLADRWASGPEPPEGTAAVPPPERRSAVA